MNNFRGGCWTIDEKMGQTYVHYEMANTLTRRDYKGAQAVTVEVTDDISKDNRPCDGELPSGEL